MIRLEQPVIVEGKYDKITLENVIDALIIPTNGFAIFKDTEKCDLIRQLAGRSGIIVMTDSDSAGALIRSYIKNIAGDAEIINVYIPRLSGKEKRKTAPSKEGLLGVEGMNPDVILAALQKSGVFAQKTEKARRKITKTDMFTVGLSGGEDSSEKRREFLRFTSLPENLSPNAMLDILNTIYTYEQFIEAVEKWQNHGGRD